MCIFAGRFDVFELVNFFHLWKLIKHCLGCGDNDDGDDDVDNNDKKTMTFM